VRVLASVLVARMWADQHPANLFIQVLAASHYLFTHVEKMNHFAAMSERDERRQTTVFYIPKSGLNVPSFYNPYRQVAACPVPDIVGQMKMNEGNVLWNDVLQTQPQLKIVPGVEQIGEEKSCPIVSLGGRRWVLVDASAAENMIKGIEARNVAFEGQSLSVIWFARKSLETGKEGEQAIESVTCRVLGDGGEDEGNANAAILAVASISLRQSGDLAEQVKGLNIEDSNKAERSERKVFGVQTGRDIGRPGTIAIEVDVKIDGAGERKIESIIVSGRSHFTIKGELIGT
jgi:hypothetical protein